LPQIAGTTKAIGGGGKLFPDLKDKMLRSLKSPMAC